VSLFSVVRVLSVLFFASEVALAVFRRARLRSAEVRDDGSLRALWAVIAVSVTMAVLAQRVPFGRIRLGGPWLSIAALVLLAVGLAIRWAAIVALGRFFTVDVAIHRDHRVIQAGPYRFVRHPSYSGLLLAFLGVGVGFSSWLSLVLLMAPIAIALAVRIATEERALHAALGPEYADYCARTRRLVPGIY
jgi:protein-S-isoprenylcysteine O-methyltransferase Ste14